MLPGWGGTFRDPAGFYGGLNPYVYAGNSPADLVDFLGLWSWDGVLSAVGKGCGYIAAAAAGVAVGIVLAPVLGPGAIIAGGAVAGAIIGGVNELYDQKEFCLTCILKAMGKGASLGLWRPCPSPCCR